MKPDLHEGRDLSAERERVCVSKQGDEGSWEGGREQVTQAEERGRCWTLQPRDTKRLE